MTDSTVNTFGPDLGRELYTKMALAYAVDERLRKGIARGEFATVIWPSRGQEAIPAGIAAALNDDDRLVTTYRGLHDHVCKGVPLTDVIGEVLGRAIGASGGKGGTMHITAPEQGVMLTTGIVGAGIPVSVGLALAARQQESDRVVVVTFGDGATNTGSFHEGVNLAAVWKLPVIFVCQNNLYAELTPIADTMNIDEVWKRALAFDIPGVRVDGNDPEAMYSATIDAAARARAGDGPTLIEAVTFRFNGHYAGDTMKYMPKEELAAAKLRDPMVTYRRKLVETGHFTEADIDEIDAAAKAEVAVAVKAVIDSGYPSVDALDNDLYADMEGVPA
ncbi:thiamine pyrophosphate-dependent dehydrogenase E1 component subunit alpha [Rhodococcus fascians]|nr:thiamine pyrophosphate-dependent dehydrogenase E1 component subunit alpha [Rhodococcus fascians]MBY4140951.1 thiamine pyrophosphate-dependent dehydrogenase E1 component subunit alpha [Rhodococcus fascians]MBY4219615.1 thiamine pyrophosphate-dependent dehydrogenase E1 component subunit alpha [Rhodococcus fascians]MBY4221924.1 thiamine pyrophosphate-dependent dehydrogenase E1 component subunit alpha [Rhodococcus fascians]MBY4233925.1 thiamine pyrophosphate-dependent dehydrogenase E1 component 